MRAGILRSLSCRRASDLGAGVFRRFQDMCEELLLTSSDQV
jgi:hypothetical protein